MSDVIKAISLSKKFEKWYALSEVSFTIPENSITGLIGRNGSGKTTLMKILAGLLDKTSGEALVFGEYPMDNLPILQKLVYTYHNIGYDSLGFGESVKLDVLLFSYKTIFPSFDSEFASKLLKYFDLNDKMKYKKLSQGMASVFNFICALACRTPITMFDEPVLGMDVTVRKSAYEILLKDFMQHPRTFIISSHLLSEIEGVLSDILLIEQGKVVLNKPIDDIRQSAYRIDGSKSAINEFSKDKNVIAEKASEMSDFAIIYEPYNDVIAEQARKFDITVSAVGAEDLCVYLTAQNKEDELACLW